MTPMPDDMPPNALAPSSSCLPPPITYRAPPPVAYADRVYREDADGYFARVGSTVRARGGADGGGGLSQTLRACTSTVASTLSDAEYHARTITSGALQRVASAAGLGLYGGAAGDEPGVGGEGGFASPISWEMMLASALLHLVVAPTRFAAGLLAGTAMLESVIVSNLDEVKRHI